MQQLLQLPQLFDDVGPHLQRLSTALAHLRHPREELTVLSVVPDLGNGVNLLDEVGSLVVPQVGLHDLAQELGAGRAIAMEPQYPGERDSEQKPVVGPLRLPLRHLHVLLVKGNCLLFLNADGPDDAVDVL